ncbi:MAG: hypothetical protein K8E66_13310, partial [Phycisphaerales bacterium]|nr:hypothetical protein [Phycisphaerales bacterium]
MTLGDRGYSLELHRHGASVPIDLTPHVIDITDTHGRVQPYGGIDVTLDVPLWNWDRLPDPDDWLVLRDAASGTALQVGVVDGPNGAGLTTRGATVETKVTRLNAPTWLDFLGRALIFMTDRHETRGTLFAAKDWLPLLDIVLSIAEKSAMGVPLGRFLRHAANIRLPASLTGERLGDAVRVVYDATTAELFSARSPRSVEKIPGGVVQGVDAFKGGQAGTPLLGMLLAIFWGAPQIVELFPSIEALGTRPARLVSAWGGPAIIGGPSAPQGAVPGEISSQ